MPAMLLSEVFTIHSTAGDVVFLTNEKIRSIRATLVTVPSAVVCFRQLRVSGIHLFLTFETGESVLEYVPAESRYEALHMLDEINGQLFLFTPSDDKPVKEESSDSSDSED
jgi:hypothetical protein